MFGFLKCIRIFPIVLVALLVLSIFPDHATATDGTKADVFAGVFCNVFKVAKDIGKPLLLLIVLFIAALAYFGKVQLITIIMIVVGAAIFFGAPTVVNLITTGGDGDATKLCAANGYDVLKGEDNS
ncbi:TrbC/VirB2 family protein [Candidatus Mesenet endosymbiont of Agriotes lineatus]|uniref:TrbC/VirB2 family protein n=1 Tax=Candidatus Mesenet endosymbiont of Agriotes lineatus TaxID=3077948 RepID=UPI0030D0923B